MIVTQLDLIVLYKGKTCRSVMGGMLQFLETSHVPSLTPDRYKFDTS